MKEEQSILEKIISLFNQLMVKIAWELLKIVKKKNEKQIRQEIYFQEKWYREPEYRKEQQKIFNEYLNK